MLTIDNNVHSTQPLYEMRYIINTKKSTGYTNEPDNYESVTEEELTPMALAVSESSFKDDWDLDDIEENNYWDSFID